MTSEVLTAATLATAQPSRVEEPHRHTALYRSVVVCWTGLLLCALIPGYVLVKMSEDQAIRVELGEAAVLQLAITAWAGARLTAMIAAGRLRPVAFFFWCYVYVWLGVAGAAQIAAQMTPVAAPLNERSIRGAQVMILVGLLAWELGGLYIRARPRPLREPRTVTVSRLRVPLTMLLLAASPLIVVKLGGIRALFTSRQATGDALRAAGLIATDDKAAGTLLVAGATVGAFLLLYLTLWRFAQLPKRTTSGWALVVTLIALNLVINNPISLPRYWFGTVALSLVLLSRRLSLGRTFMACVVLCLVVVFPYADKYRYSGAASAGLGVHGSTPLAEQFVSKSDYDSFPQVITSAELVAENGPTYGRQAEGVLLFWLPRKIWPDKPYDTGVVLAQYNDFLINTNLSAPLWAEFYVNFGLVAVAIGFAGLGLASRRLDDGYLRGILSGRHTVVTLVTPVLATYQMIILRGSLLQAMSRLAVLVALGLLLLRVVRRSGVNGEPGVGGGSVGANGLTEAEYPAPTPARNRERGFGYGGVTHHGA